MRHDLILTVRDIYIIANLKPLTKFTSSTRSIEFKYIDPWNMSQMITKTVPIHLIIVVSCDETGHLILSLTESQWKLRPQHDQNFLIEGKPLRKKC